MNKIFSCKIALTICAVVLAAIFLNIQINTEVVAGREFPNASGDFHHIYRCIGSLMLAIACITFFAGRVEDTKSQQLVLNGCILGFAVMFITLGTMTVTQVANITGGTIVFAVLTALCVCTRVRTKSD
jgi:hypothetical protein